MRNRAWGSAFLVCLLAACGEITTDITDAPPGDVDAPQGTVDASEDIDAGPAIDAAIDAPSVVMYTLTVSTAGSGAGSVTSNTGGIDCTGTCSASYVDGTNVTLTPHPTGGSTFAGWSGACTGMGGCSVPMTATRAVTASFDAPVTPNLMFVTSTTQTGNLGGLAGADAICQARAQAGGRAGTYKAWLSTSTVNANTRFGTASGWVRVDGKPFANRLTDLGNGKIFYPPNLDEFGANVGQVVAVTNTTIGGVVHPNSGGDCLGFTSSAAATPGTGGGYTNASSHMFQNYTYPTCATGGRLYCFGVDRAATVTAPAVSGSRKAFQRLWTPGGGIASADAACQVDATAAGLSGSYRALLATTGASALSRFNLAGGTWVRVDNAVILPTAQAWSTATNFQTGPNLSANAQTSYGNYLSWGGAPDMNTAGTAASTCNNWTDTAMTAMKGTTGTISIATLWTNTTYQCNFQSATITCLEQ